jgi:formylglycine-generating enzyme required for sulfatase activity
MELAAWFSTISENRLHEVGKLQPNKWGLYDILGNVWEWALYQEEDEDPNHNRILATKAEAFGGAFDTESSQLLFPRKRALSYKDQYTGFRCISRDGS